MFLPWLDFLHEGPVPCNFTLSQLSKIRAQYIASKGIGDFDTVYNSFKERDRMLLEHENYEKIILWFEDDLHDQLQMIQVLSWFKHNLHTKIELSLICTQTRLGESTSTQIHQLFRYERKITQEYLDIADNVWSAFCATTPLKLYECYQEKNRLFPFLNDALKRLLEEYPNTINGLSRTAHQALLVIANGEKNPEKIFKTYQTYEERRFIGDIIFWKMIDEFVEYGVIEVINEKRDLDLTPLGKEIITGKKNWLEITPINHYIGGVQLSPDKLWCWDIKKKNIARYYFSKALSAVLRIK
jgi:hypothetical protein